MNANLALCHRVVIHLKPKSRNYPKPKLPKTQIPQTPNPKPPNPKPPNPKLYTNPKIQDPNILGEFWYWYIPINNVLTNIFMKNIICDRCSLKK